MSSPAISLLLRRGPRNPYRRADRRKQFGGMINDFTSRSSALFHRDGRPNKSNNIGEAFWRGFDGGRFIWDPESPLAVAYRAGEEIAAAVKA